MSILHEVKAKGNFLKMQDARWIIVSDETARQKIAHAIQYQIRNDFSQQNEGAATSKMAATSKNTVLKSAAVKASSALSSSSSVKSPNITRSTGAKSNSNPSKLRVARPLPTTTTRQIPESQQVPHDVRGFPSDAKYVPPITESRNSTIENSYQQWLLERADDNRSNSATTTVSDRQVLESIHKLRCKTKDRFDPYSQPYPSRMAMDQFDFSQQMDYAGAQYTNHQHNINAMAYDLYSDHRHIIENRNFVDINGNNYLRKIPSFLQQIDNMPLQQAFGGVLFNDGKLPAPPTPVIHSLDVSGVSQWDGSVDFLENAECVEVKNDDNSVPPHDPYSSTDGGVVTDMNFKQPPRIEPVVSYPSTSVHSALALLKTSTETEQSQQQSLSFAIMHHPSTTTTTTTARDDTMIGISPMDSLLRAASDFSRDDSSCY